jgi:hypothetical protein
MKLAIAMVLVCDLFAVGTVAWINEFERLRSSNPFITKGITIYADDKAYELGFRKDGVVVWRNKQ